MLYFSLRPALHANSLVGLQVSLKKASALLKVWASLNLT